MSFNDENYYIFKIICVSIKGLNDEHYLVHEIIIYIQ